MTRIESWLNSLIMHTCNSPLSHFILYVNWDEAWDPNSQTDESPSSPLISCNAHQLLMGLSSIICVVLWYVDFDSFLVAQFYTINMFLWFFCKLLRSQVKWTTHPDFCYNLPFELVNMVFLIENQETKSNICIIHHNNKVLGYNM